ncbi:MAG: hypothetical protein ACFB22_07920 [Rhodothalassiaceae bacterium]
MSELLGYTAFSGLAGDLVDRWVPRRSAGRFPDAGQFWQETRRRRVIVALMSDLSLGSGLRALGPQLGPKTAQDRAREAFAGALLSVQTMQDIAAGRAISAPGPMALIADRARTAGADLQQTVGRALSLEA